MKNNWVIPYYSITFYGNNMKNTLESLYESFGGSFIS